MQTRSAVAVAAFIEFCTGHNIAQPPDKIVKNLCTFLCQDTGQTPTFAHSRKLLNGVLSFSTPPKEGTSKNGKDSKDKDKDKDKDVPAPVPEDPKARLSRRGAGLAFNELSRKFGGRLLTLIPNMWPSMAGGLLSAFPSDSKPYIQHRKHRS